jgi:hypothetical protein
MTVGGNLIDYPGKVSTRTADISTVKCLVNSTVSTLGAKLMAIDLKNFYLGTPMERPEFMKIHISKIPPEIIIEYQLYELGLVDKDGYVWMCIDKGMYGLPQAGILANKLLSKRLAKHGYYQCRHTSGLWKHTTRPITFTLIVDDFAVKYVGIEHAQHLVAALKQDYEITVDWEAALYAGITLKWDYDNRTVDLSMPGYVQTMLDKFDHPMPTRPEDSPYLHNKSQYRAAIQLTDPIDDSAPLSPEEKQQVQSIVGTNWYYGRSVDPTSIMALSALASQQAKPTQNTAKRIVKYLNYMATHQNATIRYQASDMLLKIHADSSYLNEPEARSRQGAHFYLGNNMLTKPEVFNGPILNTSDVEKNVMSSAAEAEILELTRQCTTDYLYAWHWKKWATHNLPHQFNLTTPWPPALPTWKSNNDNPAQSTCIATGYKIMSNKASITFTGPHLTSISLTTSPNTMQPSTTATCASTI